MRLLLDTHILIWVMSDSRRLPKAAASLIRREDVFVSATSIWEISIKAALGKIAADPRAIPESVEPAGFSVLPIRAEHAVRVFELGRHHNDPFDRLLVAQAQVEGMTLLTMDESLSVHGDAVRVVQRKGEQRTANRRQPEVGVRAPAKPSAPSPAQVMRARRVWSDLLVDFRTK